MRWLGAAVGLAVLARCVDQRGEPAEIKWDRDACEGCAMVISERNYAAQVRGPNGAMHLFDDVGCAARWLGQQRWGAEPSVRVWVALDAGWVDARTARFLTGQTSPMGYGFAALDERQPGLTFSEVQQRAAAARGNRP